MNDETESHDAQLRKQNASDTGGPTQIIGRDTRLTGLLEFIKPIISALALAAIYYFANKIGQLSEALATTNTQIAVMIEQNRMLGDGYKDHENRIRDLEGHKFRGVPGYGEEVPHDK